MHTLHINIGHSVNDGIPPHLCSLSYVTIDNAIHNILQLGEGTMLAKIDIKSAFRLLPVDPTDRHLFGEEIYILITASHSACDPHQNYSTSWQTCFHGLRRPLECQISSTTWMIT